MDKKTAKQRIIKLREEIEKHRYLYHVLNKPEITDEVYTSLRHELYELEKKYPEFKIKGSPSERIGGKVLKKFEKVEHKVPQWSLDDAFSPDDLRDWENKNLRILKKKYPDQKIRLNYFVEPKIDGLHIVLTYKKGVLETGATRGDGQIGENVTNNIKTIESIPLKLKKKLDIIVEGECWLSKKELERINKSRKKKEEPLFANTRNAASGSIRQLDPKIAAKRNLDSFIYELHNRDKKLKNQAQTLKFLKRLGFKVNEHFRVLKNLKDIKDFYQEIGNKRDKLKYAIDGIVIKINQKKYQKDLG
ncbi:MAG: NAD-dependent DNA ligase LigA, partial [Candidatus Moranbacteria bacterium]|nr:NAD-dependent DNA ligase LigA [Candidatus Moranbacteria bacterium]